MQRYQIVDASWPAIIDDETFYSVQKQIEENREKERARFKTGQRRFFLLSGIIRCGECERALIGQTSYGRSAAHRYYGHKIIVGETNTCKLKRFRAEEVEAAVVAHLDEMLLRAGHLDKVESNIKQILGGQAADTFVERERIQKELSILEKDIESAFRLHAEMDKNPEVLALVRDKLEKLAERKRTLAAYLESLESNVRRNKDAKEARSVIEDRALAFKKGWNKASPVTQKRLVRRLIERLIYTQDGLHTYYVTAKDSEMYLPVSKDKKASESSSGAGFANVHFLNSSQRYPGDSFLSPGASVVRAGGGGGSRTLVQTCDGKSATCLATRFVLLP